MVVNIKKLEDTVLFWLDMNNICPYNLKLESNVLGTNINIGYFGNELSKDLIIDFEECFCVQKEYENIDVLDYKNYDKINKKYVNLCNCQYIFNGVN